jgi:Zn-dependent metalloprotease
MFRTERARLVLVAGIAMTSLPATARAQSGHVGPNEARLSAAQALAARHEGVSVRWSLETGTPARIRFADRAGLAGASPAECASALLEGELAPLFAPGLKVASSAELVPGGTALLLVKSNDLGNGRTMVDFVEVVDGVPVLESMVKVELAAIDGGWAAAWIFARFFSDIPSGEALGTFSSEVESSIAARFPTVMRGRLGFPTVTTRVVAAQGLGYRTAFSVKAHVGANPPLPFRIIIDANTGEELSRSPLSCWATATGTVYETNPNLPASSQQPLTGLYVFQGANKVVTDANGNHNLTGAVTLSASVDDPGLQGPQFHVFVDNKNEISYSGPADIALDYQSSDYHADEVAAWVNAMTFNDYCSKTYGPKMAAAVATRLPILIDSNFANAFYSPTPMTFDGEQFPGYADLGIFGNQPCAKDDTVLRHEHSHGFWQQLADLYGGPDDQALGINEGMADYFPCVHNEDPILGAGVGQGIGRPYIRSCTDFYQWPQDDNGDPHRVGNIVTGALWKTRTQADAANAGDRLKVDQAVFQGVLRYGTAPTLLQMRDAIVAGDQAANNGAFTSLLEQNLHDHGIGPAPQTPPALPPGGVAPPAPAGAPTLGALTDQTVAVGSKLDIAVTASDASGNPITLAASKLANSTLTQSSTTPAAGTFEFTPTASQVGTIRETFTASDGMLANSVTISIHVIAAGASPNPGSAKAPAGTAVAGSTASAAKAGAGGGGLGCEVVATSPSATTSLPLAALVLVLAFCRRRTP